jgi:NAD(P)-dependent dehydrogenase (short-subunit alcohol dehydrogenase family)
MKDLRGKAVLVTGAASGIGRATAKAFAGKGANPVIVIDIDAEGLSETAGQLERIGATPVPFAIDVTDFEAISTMADEVIERFVCIDVLVNVAGVSLICPVEQLDLDDWERVLNVDLWGVINTVTAIYPHMVERGTGHIVNVASTDGLFTPGLYYSGPYCAAKSAVVGLSENLLYEAMFHGIGVTCVCPGAVDTPIFDSTPVKGLPREVIAEAERLYGPFKEAPEDTASAIVKAVENDKFLLVTTPLMKIAYFVRRHFPWLWFMAMKLISRSLKKMVDKVSEA